MPVYAIAQLTIHDRPRYDRYAARFMSVLARYRGALLAADESPEVVEGAWDREKLVLLSFPDRAEFERWSQSAEYQEIARDRIASSDCTVLLVNGSG